MEPLILPVKRPNLGCRQLVYNHYSKILPAIVNDMADWNADTRLQAAKLLYVMLVNEENNITQHLDKTLLGLYKACCDEESKVVDFVSWFCIPVEWVNSLINT